MAEWLQNISTWLQNLFDLGIKDIALLMGGILTVLAVLWLGIYSGKPRYREAARFGWFLLIVAFAIVAWGLYNRDPGSG